MIKSIFNLFSNRKIQIIVLAGIILFASLYFKNVINHWIDYGLKIDWLQFNFKTTYLWCALLLMPVNWLCEYGKFILLSNLRIKYSHRQLAQSILAGISLSSFTPMKTGDYIGRLVYLKRADWTAALKAVFWGNWLQFLWLVLGGLIGLWFFREYLDISNVKFGSNYFWLIYSVIIVLIILWFYVRLELFLNLLNRLPKWKKFVLLLNDFTEFKNKHNVFKALILSGLRYFVYTFQLWLLIRFMGIEVSPFYLYFGILLVFLIQTLLPFLSWMGLIGRTGITIFVLNRIGVGEIESGISSVLLWMINILIPAVIGFLLLLLRFLKMKKDEK